MVDKKCKRCGSTQFTEATDYMPIKPSKGSFRGANKIYTFCLDCGEVDSIRIENTIIFKKIAEN
ncbi:hypothetical protein C7Y47_06340 [Lysinibacillus sphaericus]|uniref:Transcription initiation factor TFIIIB n=1 Tax=Lysinibacillus sphaericus TaxID=1421 RepID=A0A544UPY8_LYSSH|nr:hypothetical protein [Lysinibacillus sp. SDF0037]TQR35904.1 hypothetical protein C7Y47_06340 [Lysinibacillus sp. SDF0037]